MTGAGQPVDAAEEGARVGQHVGCDLVVADHLDKLHARDRIEEMDADQPFRPRQSLAQLLERNARRVGGEDRVRLHLRLDAGEDLALEFEIFRYRLDDQIGAGDSVALEVGNQAVEGVAHPPPVVAADLSVKFRGALDGAADGVLAGVAERHHKSMPSAPRRDVAAHGAGADDVHAASVPLSVGEVLQILAQEKHAHEILRRVADEQFGEGGNLRLLHGFGVAAVLDP